MSYRPRTKTEAVETLADLSKWLKDEYRHHDAEIAEWTKYAENVAKAHGMTYSGSGPEDPGPDPNDFDVWAIKNLREESDNLNKLLGFLREEAGKAPEGGYIYRILCKAIRIGRGGSL